MRLRRTFHGIMKYLADLDEAHAYASPLRDKLRLPLVIEWRAPSIEIYPEPIPCFWIYYPDRFDEHIEVYGAEDENAMADWFCDGKHKKLNQYCPFHPAEIVLYADLLSEMLKLVFVPFRDSGIKLYTDVDISRGGVGVGVYVPLVGTMHFTVIWHYTLVRSADEFAQFCKEIERAISYSAL